MLQDLLLAVFNDAIAQAKALEDERMGGLTGGMGLPPGLFSLDAAPRRTVFSNLIGAFSQLPGIGPNSGFGWPTTCCGDGPLPSLGVPWKS